VPWCSRSPRRRSGSARWAPCTRGPPPPRSRTICATATATSRTATGTRRRPPTTARSPRRPARCRPRRTASAPRIFIILKDYKGGLDFIDRAKARYPSAPEVLEQEALILWETDRKEEAIKVAETVVATRPQAFTNQKLIGEYYAPRDPGRTVAAYEHYLANRPADLEAGDVLPRVRLGFAYLATARLAIADGDDARAEQLFGKAADQFDLVQRKFGKRPNAENQRRQRPVCRADRPGPVRSGGHGMRARGRRSPADRQHRLGVVQPRDRLPGAQADQAGAHRRHRVHPAAQGRGARLHPARRHPTSPTATGPPRSSSTSRPRSCSRRARPTTRSSCRSGSARPTAGCHRRVAGRAAASRSRSRSCRAGSPPTRAASSSRSSSAARTSRRGRTPARSRSPTACSAAPTPPSSPPRPAATCSCSPARPSSTSTSSRRRASGSRPRASSGRPTSPSSAAWC